MLRRSTVRDPESLPIARGRRRAHGSRLLAGRAGIPGRPTKLCGVHPMTTSVELRAARADLLDRADAVVSAAERRHRNLNSKEQSEFDALAAQADQLGREISRQEAAESTRATSATHPGTAHLIAPQLD